MKQAIAVMLTAIVLTTSTLAADTDGRWQEPVLDNCTSTDNTSSIGTAWEPVTDSDRGGTSSVEWESSEGSFSVTGNIEPVPGSRGPGTAGMMLPLSADGKEYDISEWDGVRVTIKRSGAPLLLRIVSTDILNEDHFAVMVPELREFDTFEYSFRELGQVMSAQQPWTGKNVTGIELVTFGWMPTEFSWEISELAFYKNEKKDSILNR